MNIFTSRACPYRCIFCHNMFGKGFRARSPENIIEEISAIMGRFNIRDFEILDDIFNLNAQRAMEIYNMILQKGLKLTLCFPNGLRCDKIDDEQLELMKQVGVIHTAVAVETASPRLQKLIRKHLDIAKVNEFIRKCDERNIFTRGYFMIGFPSETRDEIMETIRFAAKSRLHTALFFITTPFKNTELYGMCGEALKNKQVDFSLYSTLTAPFNLSEVSDDDLLRLQRFAYRKFYMDPRRIWRILRVFPQKQHIPVGLSIALKFMFRQRGDHPLVPKYLTH